MLYQQGLGKAAVSLELLGGGQMHVTCMLHAGRLQRLFGGLGLATDSHRALLPGDVLHPLHPAPPQMILFPTPSWQ